MLVAASLACLTLIDAFDWLVESPSKAVITLTLKSFLNQGTRIVMYLDAFLWGMGGSLTIAGRPTERFSDGHSEHDIALLGIIMGEGAACAEGGRKSDKPMVVGPLSHPRGEPMIPRPVRPTP